MDIFKGLKDLMDQEIYFTDCKLGNTVFDTKKNKGQLIDLGGCFRNI